MTGLPHGDNQPLLNVGLRVHSPDYSCLPGQYYLPGVGHVLTVYGAASTLLTTCWMSCIIGTCAESGGANHLLEVLWAPLRGVR